MKHGPKKDQPRLLESNGFQSVLSSVVSIIIGLVFGALLMLIIGLADKSLGMNTVWEGIRLVFGGLFSTGRNATGGLSWGFNSVNFGNMLFRATPLIMTGLSQTEIGKAAITTMKRISEETSTRPFRSTNTAAVGSV